MSLNALGTYLRRRAKEVEISQMELSRRSGVSRQTLHTMGNSVARLPEMDTLVRVAVALRVHPLRLIHLAFEDYRLPPELESGFKQRGDASIFVADVTIPDGTVVNAGSRFTKVWAVQNVGTVAWEGRRLQCVDDRLQVTGTGLEACITDCLRPVHMSIDVPYTPPGAVVEMSVDFVAPSVPGSYFSYWKSVFPDGSLCMPQSTGLSCMVRVISMKSTDVSGPA